MDGARHILRVLGIGWYVVISIGGGAAAGAWAGEQFNLNVLCIVVGLVCGVGVAVAGTYRMLAPFFSKDAGAEKFREQ